MTFEPPQSQPTPTEPTGQPPVAQPSEAQQAQQITHPVWARPASEVQWQQTPPLEYHQLYRGAARYRWWKPLLALILAGLYYLTLSVVFILPAMLVYALTQGADLLSVDLNVLALPDTQNPWSIFVSLSSIVLMIPAVWLAMLSTGLTPTGRGWSVALRMRWGWIWRTVWPAIVCLVVMNAIGIALELTLNPSVVTSEPPAVEIDVTLALISLLLVFLLVPLQATAEELVFRGMFMQSIGAWLGGIKGEGGVARLLRGPWIPILVPALAFGFSHIYNIWGFFAVIAMAIAAGWLTWRTGGLEAAISLHVVNNLVAFVFMAMGSGGETGQSEDAGGPGGLIGQVIGLALFCWWVDRSFSRRDGRRTRIDWVHAS